MHALRRLFPLHRGTALAQCRTTRWMSAESADKSGAEPAAGAAAATATATATAAETGVQEKQLKELKVGSWVHACGRARVQESYLLALADMENLRQRTRREVEAASQFAIQRFCKDIVGVADVLEMALASVQSSLKEDAAALPNTNGAGGEGVGRAEKQLRDLIDGLGMTLGEMQRTLNRHGVSVVDPLHQKFDPNLHNALFEVPATEVEPGTIVSVQKKGYILNQRVIRPAEVGVARKTQ